MFGRKKEAPPVPKKTPGKGNALMAQVSNKLIIAFVTYYKFITLIF